VRADIEAKLDTLEKLVRKMDVPAFRTRSVLWLARNMAIRNSGHANFQEAQELVKELCQLGVR
jgi:hypothetical protein